MKIIVNSLLLCLLSSSVSFAQAPAAPAKEPPPKATDAITVELLKAGAEPKQKVRYKFKQDAEYISVKMKMGMAMSIGGQALPKQDMPGIVQTISVEPIAVKDGVMDYKYTLSKMDIEPGGNPLVVSKMKESIRGIVGMTGKGRVDDRGFSEGAEIEFPPEATPELIMQIKGFNDTMSRLSAPLPDEPIGVGAEWKVVLPIGMNGIAMKGVNTYTVTAIEGDIVKTTVVSTMEAKDQKLDDPNLPPQASVTIDSIKGGGDGTVNFNLASMSPVSKMTIELKQAATIGMEGQPSQKMGMDISMEMNVAPGEKPEDDDDDEDK